MKDIFLNHGLLIFLSNHHNCLEALSFQLNWHVSRTNDIVDALTSNKNRWSACWNAPKRLGPCSLMGRTAMQNISSFSNTWKTALEIRIHHKFCSQKMKSHRWQGRLIHGWNDSKAKIIRHSLSLYRIPPISHQVPHHLNFYNIVCIKNKKRLPASRINSKTARICQNIN